MAVWFRKRMARGEETASGDLSAVQSPRALLALGLTAPLAGLGAGLVGASFRWRLELAGRLRDALIRATSGWSIGGRTTLSPITRR